MTDVGAAAAAEERLHAAQDARTTPGRRQQRHFVAERRLHADGLLENKLVVAAAARLGGRCGRHSSVTEHVSQCPPTSRVGPVVTIVVVRVGQVGGVVEHGVLEVDGRLSAQWHVLNR